AQSVGRQACRRPPHCLRRHAHSGDAACAAGPMGSVVRLRAAEAEMSAPLLRVSEVSRWFGGLRAVDEVQFDLNGKEILGLIGPNGAGKTTLFETISGFMRPTKGAIAFDGRDV